MELTVTREGENGAVKVSFNYDDEPVWKREPAVGLFVAEVRKYPRDDEHTPEWLREKIEQARIEYPEAFDS